MEKLDLDTVIELEDICYRVETMDRLICII